MDDMFQFQLWLEDFDGKTTTTARAFRTAVERLRRSGRRLDEMDTVERYAMTTYMRFQAVWN